MLLSDADKEKYFHVANGTVIRSIWELEPALQVMGDETFSYHVNQEKNDFASWVREVISDPQLADGILGIKERQDMRIAILRRLLQVLRDNARD